MSKIRSMRQHTDAPRQEEGPSTGAALLAGGRSGTGHRRRAFRPCPPAGPAAVRRAPGRGRRGIPRIAVADGRRSALLVQAGELLGFTALTALAVQRDSPGLLGAGWLAHVTWDALHHRGRGPTRVRSWYPVLCIGYDVAVAVPLLAGRL